MKATSILAVLVLASCASNRVLPDQEVMLGATDDFRKCYHQIYPNKASTKQRIVSFHLDVAADGSVSSAKVTENDEKEPKFHSCLEQEAKKLKFPAAAGTRTIIQPYNFY